MKPSPNRLNRQKMLIYGTLLFLGDWLTKQYAVSQLSPGEVLIKPKGILGLTFAVNEKGPLGLLVNVFRNVLPHNFWHETHPNIFFGTLTLAIGAAAWQLKKRWGREYKVFDYAWLAIATAVPACLLDRLRFGFEVNPILFRFGHATTVQSYVTNPTTAISWETVSDVVFSIADSLLLIGLILFAIAPARIGISRMLRRFRR
jgi:lipoprotein signal peptidase